MKRFICILCAVLMIGMLMTACSDNGSSDKAASVSADASLTDIYSEIKSEVTLPEMLEFTDVDRLDRNYGITEDMVDEFAGGINSSGTAINEIVLIKAKDADSAAEIEKKLNNRLESLLKQSRNYRPEEAEELEKCKVEKNDMYVSMIVSTEAEKITEIYKKHFK